MHGSKPTSGNLEALDRSAIVLHKSNPLSIIQTMKFSALALTAALATTATSAIELTPDNWDAETAGKTIFVKMFAPW